MAEDPASFLKDLTEGVKNNPKFISDLPVSETILAEITHFAVESKERSIREAALEALVTIITVDTEHKAWPFNILNYFRSRAETPNRPEGKRKVACEALGRLAEVKAALIPKAALSLQACLEDAQHTSPAVRITACHVLQKWLLTDAGDDLRLLPLFMGGAQNDPDEDVRAAVCEALQEAALDKAAMARTVVPFFETLLKTEKHPRVTKTVYRALKAIAEKHPEQAADAQNSRSSEQWGVILYMPAALRP